MTDHPEAPVRHASDHMANERTFLAWIRTSVALIGLGFVMAKFSVWLREFVAPMSPHVNVPHAGLSLPAGLVMIALGALVSVLALFRHRSISHSIDHDRFAPARSMITLVATTVVLVGAGLIVYLFATGR